MPYINTISLEKIKRYINYEYEFCGYIFYDVNNPDELNIIKNNTGPNVKIERGSCTYKHGYRRCIWHTHPYISKSYPSPEDLLKVLKHPDNIKISILFTAWGIWEISLTDRENIDSNIITHLPYHIDKLQKICDVLYKKTYQNKTNYEYSDSKYEFIKNFIISIMEYYPISIIFTPWKDLTDIYIIKSDSICSSK
uniref:JAB domain-containing protein n=1 Tax=viral metagenome TaxID=1070528 RepID=A0A6C0CZR6_9ZZZZ